MKNPPLFLFRWVIPALSCLVSTAAIYLLVTRDIIPLAGLMMLEPTTILLYVGYIVATLALGYFISGRAIAAASDGWSVMLTGLWLNSFLVTVGYPAIVVPLVLTMLAVGMEMFALILLALMALRLVLVVVNLHRGSFSM